jgi:hypothetical protein
MRVSTPPESRIQQPVGRRVPGIRPPPAGRSVTAPFPALDLGLAVAALVAGLLALVVLAGIPAPGGAVGDTVRGLGLLCFWLVAPGAVLVSRLRLPALTALGAVPLVGISLLIASATVASWTGLWVPRGSAAVLALATVTTSAVDLWRHRGELRGLRARPPSPATVTLALALLACLELWIGSLPAIARARPSVLGLMAAGPWTFPAAVLGTSLVLLAALRGRHLGLAAAGVLTLIVVLRSTASVVSTVPTAAWSYKHIGVAQSLQALHHVAAGGDIYMNWPGMFAAAAYLSDSSGVPAIDLARWFPPAVHVLLALETAALARALGARAAGCVAAAGLVVALNWVGQDYFSPQAVAMCLAAGVVVLLVQARASRACALLALAIFGAIVVCHQLTPFWLLGLALVLVVLRLTPWWLAGAMALVLAAFLLSRWQIAEAYGIFTGFNPLANAASSVPAVPALGREVGGVLAQASAGLMWGTTLLVLVRRVARLGWSRGWRSSQVLVPGAIAFSPFLLLAAQDYGGEATLRVTLYSTLGCSAVLGPALADAVRRRAGSVVTAVAWSVLLLAVTTASGYALWSVDLIHPEDVAAARWLAQRPGDPVVVPAIAVWPGRTSIDYVRFVGRSSAIEPGLDQLIHYEQRFQDTPSIPLSPGLAMEIAQIHPTRPTYVVFTASMRAYDAYYATYTPGSYEATLLGLARDQQWQLVRHQDDLWVFLYRGLGPPVS